MATKNTMIRRVLMLRQVIVQGLESVRIGDIFEIPSTIATVLVNGGDAEYTTDNLNLVSRDDPTEPDADDRVVMTTEQQEKWAALIAKAAVAAVLDGPVEPAKTAATNK